jgi:hypothetical protein
MLDPATLEHLRASLEPRRERFDFAYTMNRWASEVIEACDGDSESALSAGGGANWDAIMWELLEPDPIPEPDHAQSVAIARAWARKECSDESFLTRNETCGLAPRPSSYVESAPGTKSPKTKRRPKMRDSRAGRPRADKERYAALLLAVIYREFAGEPPTRIVKPHEREQAEREYSSRFYKFAARAFELIDLKPRPQAFREAWERWERSRDFSKHAMRMLLWGGLPGFRRRKSPDEAAPSA